jgi:lysyl-tRNA synthetase, class II
VTDRLRIPYQFHPTATAASVVADHDATVQAGEETEVTVTVAGRLMLRRGQGKLTFGQLQDGTGRIQLFAPADVTPDFSEFTGLGLGDWIGVTGEVMKTKKGELSIKVRDWQLLAEAKRPFPDKWHGLTDTDTRFRQRYVDLVVTPESATTLRNRSKIISLMRQWLEANQFMEVETPMLQPIPGGALAKPFMTHHNALDMTQYLRIALELHLKRLVVGGFERVFEIGRVFRNEGMSPRHNPEFTMVELYAAYWDYSDQMRLTEELCAHIAREVLGTMKFEYDGRELDLTPPWPRRTLTELTCEAIGEDVSIETDIEKLRALCVKFDVPVKDGYGPGKLLLELYEKTVEHTIWNPVFVTDYPKEVSPLARDHRSIAGMTERFEAIVAGRELCNGYSELVDAAEQKLRFEDQVRQSEYDDEAMAMDHDYVRALEFGLPPTGGLGIGVDRLVMLITNTTTIRDVILFPTLRPEVFDSPSDRQSDSPSDSPDAILPKPAASN